MRTEAKALSRRQDFIPDYTAHYHLNELVHVLLPRNDTRGSTVVLNRRTAPLNYPISQRRSRLKKRLDSPFADDFDSRNDEARVP